MAKFRERVEEWQTTLTGLQSSIQQLTEKLANVEGRPDLAPQLLELQTALTEAKAELAELKANKPKPPKEPEPKPKPEPPTRKQSLMDRLRGKSADGLPEAVIREPRRKLPKL